MYKEQRKRESAQEKSHSMSDYLEPLGMKVVIFKDEITFSSRISQLTQKTNQFNLTTIRYTESQIKRLIKSDDHLVYIASVNDKFGDSGLTGLCLIKFLDFDAAEIDTFLLSCRIIGRNIEYAF